MSEIQNSKHYDLEERTEKFAQNIRSFIKTLPKTVSNFEDGKQLIRSSGSVGANWIEANESLSKKDFILRTKICRKEAKESRYWLHILDVGDFPRSEPESHGRKAVDEWRDLSINGLRSKHFSRESSPDTPTVRSGRGFTLVEAKRQVLINEVTELMKIFGSILEKLK